MDLINPDLIISALRLSVWDERLERRVEPLLHIRQAPLKEAGGGGGVIRTTPTGLVEVFSKLMHGRLLACSKTVAAFLAAACITVIFLQI